MTTEQRNDAQEVIELTNYIGATLGISPQNIFGKSRIPEHADARAICQYILRSRGWNYQRIADSYGQKCHATAMHNVARIERMMKLSNAVDLGLKLTTKKAPSMAETSVSRSCKQCPRMMACK